MRYPLFIAKRIIFNAQPSFSRFIIRLAIVATALSVATMVITLSMVNGFQQAVAEKVFSFWGHARIEPVNPFQPYVSDDEGFVYSDSVKQALKKEAGIAHQYTYAIKSVVLKTGGQFEGVLLKGIADGFDTLDFNRFMVSGRFISLADSAKVNGIVLSHITAERMQVKPGDALQCFFIRNGSDIRTRPMVVTGIYKTGIEEYDKNFGIGDIRFLRKLNLWEDNRVGGVEIFLNEPDKAGVFSDEVNQNLSEKLACRPIDEIYPNIFDWLAIQNQTKKIVVITMLIVAIINLITCLLILVMERTKMVGVFKALGMPVEKIGAVFWYYAGWIAVVGVGVGLILGLGLCFLQQYTGLIKMDEATYYVATVPVSIDAFQVSAVVLGSLLICLFAIRLPLFYVQRVTPISAIRFE